MPHVRRHAIRKRERGARALRRVGVRAARAQAVRHSKGKWARARRIAPRSLIRKTEGAQMHLLAVAPNVALPAPGSCSACAVSTCAFGIKKKQVNNSRLYTDTPRYFEVEERGPRRLLPAASEGERPAPQTGEDASGTAAAAAATSPTKEGLSPGASAIGAPACAASLEAHAAPLDVRARGVNTRACARQAPQRCE